MTIAERIYDKLKSARPEVAQEVLDFLEFLETKGRVAPSIGSKADSWEPFFGALKGSTVFEGEPVEIQRKLRDEWT